MYCCIREAEGVKKKEKESEKLKKIDNYYFFDPGHPRLIIIVSKDFYQDCHKKYQSSKKILFWIIIKISWCLNFLFRRYHFQTAFAVWGSQHQAWTIAICPAWAINRSAVDLWRNEGIGLTMCVCMTWLRLTSCVRIAASSV